MNGRVPVEGAAEAGVELSRAADFRGVVDDVVELVGVFAVDVGEHESNEVVDDGIGVAEGHVKIVMARAGGRRSRGSILLPRPIPAPGEGDTLCRCQLDLTGCYRRRLPG